jgi:hypothetical protein
VNKTGIVEREAATGQSGMYFRIGPHHVVVIYSPVRPDSHGVIALIKVERYIICKCIQKDAHIITSNFRLKSTAHFQRSISPPLSTMLFDSSVISIVQLLFKLSSRYYGIDLPLCIPAIHLLTQV